MKKFKLTPKIILIIVLGLITIAGIYFYFTSSANRSSRVDGTGDQGFFSFFGERKIKPLDDTTVPGVNTGTDGGDTGTTIPTDTAGGGGSGTATGAVGGSGSISLRPIGSNIGSGGSGSTGTTGAGSSTAGGNTGGANTGGTSTAGGTTTGGGTVIPQVDCTPLQLPYTDAEIAELKELTQRFYRIAANLHTDVDVENERLTRKSYFDLYNQTNKYTEQCYAELKDPKYTNKSKNSSAEWHPYLTETVLKRIATYDPRVQFVISNEEARLNQQIVLAGQKISRINTQIAFIDSLGSSANDAQKNLRSVLVGDLQTETNNLNKYKSDLTTFKSTSSGISKGIVGTFFTEDKYKLLNLRVPRQNKNARIDKIWLYAGTYIKDSGRSTNTTNDLFTPGSSLFNVNPLKSLILDQWDDSLNDAPRYDPGTPPANANLPQSYMHIFRMVEDGLRIW